MCSAQRWFYCLFFCLPARHDLKLPTPSVGANDLCCWCAVKQPITYLAFQLNLNYFLRTFCEVGCCGQILNANRGERSLHVISRPGWLASPCWCEYLALGYNVIEITCNSCDSNLGPRVYEHSLTPLNLPASIYNIWCFFCLFFCAVECQHFHQQWLVNSLNMFEKCSSGVNKIFKTRRQCAIVFVLIVSCSIPCPKRGDNS